MKKVVLLSVGSFNPVTFMHVRMFLLAKEFIYNKLQWSVLGGLISPVHDDYKKKELIAGKHRNQMVRLALTEYSKIPWIKLSQWETDQVTWNRTLKSLEYHQSTFACDKNEWFPDIKSEDQVQVMLLCGSDVLEAFSVPGLWDESQVEKIIMKFGVVCITRGGNKIEEIMKTSALLSRLKEHIIIVPEWFDNKISSTVVRAAVKKGQCVAMLVPFSVADYIKQERLYSKEGQAGASPLVFMYKAVRTAGQPDAYEEALKMADWKVVQIPVINFQYLGIPELRGCLFAPDNYSGLILTTPRAVEAVLLAIESVEAEWRDRVSNAWNSKPIYAIGEGTAALAKKAGFTCVGQEAGNESALAEVIKGKKALHDKKLLFPCGNLRLEILRNILLDNGLPVEFLECYETSAHPQLVSLVHDALQSEGFPDVNLFFSPSGVQFMDEILREESLAFKQTKYAAIGPTTADGMKNLGYNVDAVSAHPTPESVVKALQGLI